MKPTAVTRLAVLPCLAHAAISSFQNHSVRVVRLDNSTFVSLASAGQSWGYHDSSSAVCGDGLCCSQVTQKCGFSTESCSATSCMPLCSTGCTMQGNINSELLSLRNNFDLYATGTVDEREDTSVTLTAPPPGSPTLSPFPPLKYLANLERPLLGSVPYGQVITSCRVPGTIALTFDDGPWMYTSDLLDLLERKGAYATFFVCGGNFAEDQLTGYGHPHIVRRMISAGHQIGSHTWAHPDLGGLGKDEVMRQMWLNEQGLVGVLGMLPTYFRPPYLSWAQNTLDIMAKLGYHVTTLDHETDDWRGDYDSSKQNFRQKLEQSDSGTDSMLVLAHDVHERTVYELAEFMIDQAREHGYRLVTVGECLGDPIKNWYRNPYDGRSWMRDGGRSQSNEVAGRHVEPNVAHSEKGDKNQVNFHTVPPPPPSAETRAQRGRHRLQEYPRLSTNIPPGLKPH